MFVTLAKIFATSEVIFEHSRETLFTLGEIFVTPAKMIAIRWISRYFKDNIRYFKNDYCSWHYGKYSLPPQKYSLIEEIFVISKIRFVISKMIYFRELRGNFRYLHKKYSLLQRKYLLPYTKYFTTSGVILANWGNIHHLKDKIRYLKNDLFSWTQWKDSLTQRQDSLS